MFIVLSLIFGIWNLYLFTGGFSQNASINETSFFTVPLLQSIILSIILAVLSLYEKFIVFPITLLSYLLTGFFSLTELIQIFQKSWFFPISNLSSGASLIIIIISIFGTILWYRNIRHYGKKWWH
jgi:hypothetical protein